MFYNLALLAVLIPGSVRLQCYQCFIPLHYYVNICSESSTLWRNIDHLKQPQAFQRFR